MNRLYSSLLAATALTFTAAAQQLPNPGFEEEWVDCVPWTSAGNTTVQGSTPKSWNVSNTIGMGSEVLGATTIATNVTGYNSNSAVNVLNKHITPFGQSKVIPGYLGLGTSWATSTGTGQNTAGGQFGGLDFMYRPDALQFMYQSTGNDSQPTVIAYIWNGKFVQKNVSGNIVFSNPKKVDMVDRDRCVLGMSDVPQGGEVSEKGILVASINSRLQATTTSWTKAEIEFTYVTADAPEKVNVIFAAGDYFSSTPVQDNAITVDDVKLLYFSRLKSLSVNGTAVADFDPNTYEYNVEVAMPTDASAIAAECLGNSGSGKAVVALDAANNKATITVTNSNADMVGRASSDVTDIDGQSSHVYTLNFKAGEEEKDPNTKNYIGELLVKSGEPLNLNEKTSDVNVEITPNADNTSCTFLLPNFSFSEMELGDIKVENVTITHENGLTKFNGKDDAMKLGPGGVIDASVTVTGTCDSEGNLAMVIDVVWHSGADAFGDYPIDVTFNGKGDAFGTSAIGGIESDVIDENAPVEYYNIQGMKVNGDNLAPGFYIVRQGKKVSKIFVK